MTQQSDAICDYLSKFPEVRTKYVCQIFGVSQAHVDKLRHQVGAHDARKKAAHRLKISPPALDDMILQAVYKRGLVDTVLSDG